MATKIEITVNNIKDYLVITSSDYDSNIQTVIDFTSEAIENLINPENLSDISLTNILKLGKLYFLCSRVKQVLPNMATGKPSDRVEISSGKENIVIDNRSKSNDLEILAIQTLKPYLKPEALGTIEQDVLFTNDGLEPEFTLTDKSIDGEMVKTGSMEGW